MEQKLNLAPFTIHFLWISSMVNKTPFRQNLNTLEEHCNLKLCSFNLSLISKEDMQEIYLSTEKNSGIYEKQSSLASV